MRLRLRRPMVLRASLQRRLLLTLLAGFALVAVALLALDVHRFRSGVAAREAQRSAARALADALDRSDPATAVAIVRATELQFNRSRQAAGLAGIEDLQFQLQDLQGRLVHASAWLAGAPPVDATQAAAAVLRLAADGRGWQVPAVVPAATSTAAGDAGLTQAAVPARDYWAWREDGVRWRVVLLEPVVRDARLLQWLVDALLPMLLVALPLLALPLWWAVRSGLGPLQRVADVLARRPPDSLQPLGLAPPQAELQPIVKAVDGLLDRVRLQVEQERRLLQQAAHELRTPLAVLTAQAHALAVAVDPADARAARESLCRGVQRASHLIDQLLQLARLEATGLPDEDRQAVDLAALCRQSLIDLGPLADAAGLSLGFEGPDTLWRLTEPEPWHAILGNLLRNALVHLPPGHRLDLRLAVEDDRLWLDVRDDGPGPSPEDRARAFDRFHRGAQAGPGSGLGLSIVRQAARRLGGTAELHPEPPDRGWWVRLCLPDPPAAAATTGRRA